MPPGLPKDDGQIAVIRPIDRHKDHRSCAPLKPEAGSAACHRGLINANERSSAVDFRAAERQENRRRANGMV